MGQVKHGPGVTGIKNSHEGATDRKVLDENVIELVVNDALQVARDDYFILPIFFPLRAVIRGLLIGVTGVKKRELVPWYGISNKPP